MMSLYVLHVDEEVVHDVMDGVLYSVPPGEPFEFVNPFIGRKFLEHKWYHGVVEVELRRTKAGWEFMIEDAWARAEKALADADHAYNQSYIETQHQDRLLRGVPAMPPSERQKRILKRQGVNLEDYGIRPIGTKSGQERMFEEMARQNQNLMNMVAALLTGDRSVLPAIQTGAAKPVHEPEHVTSEGERVLVPPKPKRNIIAPANAVIERPDRPEPTTRLYSQGEDLSSVDPAKLGFEGDVDDPNQVPGPAMPRADKPFDLADSPLADALNMDEDRVKLKVPKVQQPSGPVKKDKVKVNI